MSRRTLVLVVAVVAFGLAMLPAAQAAQVTDVEAPDVEMMPGTETTDLTVTNSGEEPVDADVTIVDTPSGVSVVHVGSETLEPGQDTDVTLQIDADAGASSGAVSGDVNGEPFQFDVTVDNPPLPGFDDEPLDLGDVLVGETESGDVVVQEIGGEAGLDGVEWSIVSDDVDASLSFTDMDGSGWGEGSVQTGPGGEDTAGWQITVDDEVEQHETLSWTVEFWDANHPDATRQVDVEARVIYPAGFGNVALYDQLVFDEARGDTDEITRTLDLDVNNAGDLPLELDSVSASADNADISIVVDDYPEEIEGQETGTVSLAVTADTDLDEGLYEISATASASDYTIDDADYVGDLEIVHETRLDVDSAVSIGDVPIGEEEQVATDVSEALGYNDVDDLEITLEDGPDSWLTLDGPPTQLRAGGTESLVFVLAFDTDAELGADYEWTYTVDGDGIDEETVTVTASPVPLDFESIRSDLSAYDGPVADGTLGMIATMEDQMQDGETDDDDISTVLTFGSSSALYLDAATEASALLEEGDHDAAQAEIVQAAAAYNTMTLYADALESDQQRADSEEVLGAAEDDLTALIDEQAAYYEAQLESGELSLIEEAAIQRQLSRIVLLQGDQERADALQDDADEAFDAYTETVSDGERAAQTAEDTWESMASEQFVMVAGQPLLVNPANYDAFSERTDDLHAAYDDATAAFEDAGETTRAEAVAAEHDDRSDALETARLSLFAAIGLYGIVATGVVVRTARNMFWYVRDARESVTGDFLM